MGWPDYNSLSHWLLLFGQNVAVGLAVAAIYAAVRSAVESRNARFEALLTGLLFGVSAVISMAFPVRVADGLILDARNAFVMLGSLFGGPAGALVTVTLSSIYRIYLGGPIAPLGIATILATSAIGLAIARHFGERVKDFGIGQFAAIGLVDAVVIVLMTRIAYLFLDGPPPGAQAEIALLITFPAAIALIGSAMGLTHHRAERQAQHRLTDIVESVSELLWETDDQRRFTFVSPRYEQVLGLRPAEMLGRTPAELGAQWQDPVAAATHAAAFAARKPFDELNKVVQTRDGGRKIISMSGRPVFDARGRFTGYRGTAADITDREKMRAVISAISGRVGDVVGQEFLRTLVQSVSEVLGADHTIVGVFEDQGKGIRTIVRFDEGQFIENRTTPTSGMPSSEVWKGRPVVVRSDLYRRYPRFREITDKVVEGYAATPLIGSRGIVLGLLSVSFVRPLDDENVETVLQLFAGRAAAEIERMAIEEEWRSSRDRLQTTQRIGKIASIEADLVQGLSIWSPELWSILGIDSRTTVPNFERFMESVDPEDRDRVRGLRQRSVEGQENSPSEFRIVRPDGEVRWLYRQAELIRDAAGKPLKLIAMLQDVTDRHHLERQLLQSREHLLLAQRTAGIGSAEVNLRTGEEYWSQELLEILGLEAGGMEYTFERFLASVHPDDRETLRTLRGRNNVGVPTDPTEFRIVRPDGSVRWLRRQVQALHDSAGQLSGLIATHHDITDRKRMEETLRHSYEGLLRAQRMGKIGSAEVDLVKGQSVWSDEQIRIYGLNHGTPSFDEFLRLVHPEERAMVMAAREQDGQGNPSPPIEFRIIRSDGDVRWIHREVDIQRDESGKPVRLFTTQQDITERRRMEEELRLSARHLASAQRVGKMASVELDMATRRTVWSTEAFRLFRVDPASGQPRRADFLNLIHPDDRERIQAVWADEKEGRETEPFEYRLLSANGETRWIYRQAEFLRDADGRPVRLTITHQDVTEREELRRLMATLSGNLGNPIGEDFLKALIVNVAQVTGAEFAYIGFPDFDRNTMRARFYYIDGQFVDNRDIDLWEAPRAIVATRKTLRIDGHLRERFPDSPRGLGHDIDAYVGTPLLGAKGDLLGLLVATSRHPWTAPEHVETVLNLSAPRAAAEIERLATEKEAEHSRTRMAEVLAALDIARDSIILADDDRRILYTNGAAVSLMGLPGNPAQVEGRRLRDFQDGSFVPFSERVLEVLRDKGEWQGTGSWIRPSDNKTVFFDARIHRLPAGGFVGVFNDATERIRIEEEERRRQEWQAQASKLEALGNLAGGIAHDFNNLLGAILGFGQFLVEDLKPGSEQQHFAERIVAVSQRGRSLVQQILTFARRGPAESSEVNLGEIISETHDLLRATLPATTVLAVDNRVPAATVLGDKGQLSQVFVNLCVNGSDSMAGQPGRITMMIDMLDRNRRELGRLPAPQAGHSPSGVETWSEPDGTAWIVTGAKPIGPALSIAVSDTGGGIPASVGAQIFEPFFTTKGRGRGTGLGLAVVHRIVLEHGGAILVRTTQGQGTTFEILLPLVLGAADEPGRGPPGTGAARRTDEKASILVVDDDESFCAMVETALRRMGYHVQSTTDPRIAQNWLRQKSGAWDVLVTDQNMPHITGEELVRFFRAHSPATRCIICTGYSTGMNEQRARAAGADGFLLKPFDADRLAALVSRLLQRADTITG